MPGVSVSARSTLSALDHLSTETQCVSNPSALSGFRASKWCRGMSDLHYFTY